MHLKVEYRPVAELIPYARNARTHSDEQVAQIAASITEFGFVNPVLVGEDNVIIAGHGRLLAASRLGMETVPVIRLGHLSETHRRALVIADNRLAETAGWDEEMLAIELQALMEEDFNLDITGFDAAEVDKLLPVWRRKAAAKRKTTRFRRSRRRQFRSQVTCGFSASIGCCAATPLGSITWSGCWTVRWPTCALPIRLIPTCIIIDL